MIYYVLLLLSLSTVIHSQDTNSTISAPTNQEIDYIVNLSNIQIGKPFSVRFEMPEKIASILNIDSNITTMGDTDISITNLTAKSIDLEVTSFSIANYPMPSLLVTALDTNNNTNIFYTPSFNIPISNEIFSNTNLSLADIEPIYFVWDHLWTIAILIMICIIMGIFFIPRLLHPTEKKEPEIIVDPFELVNRKLTGLKIQSIELTEDSYKEFFVELSECIREFLSYTLIPLALEMPTRDITSIMKQQQIDKELQEIIVSILKNTDRAKYAKQIFAQERINEVIEDSFKLVKLINRKQEMEKANELRKS